MKMKNFLFVTLICLLASHVMLAQLPCPEITSLNISPGSGTFCPGDEFTLTWDGINLENAIVCGFCWYMYEEGFEQYGWILGCPYQVNYGPCVSPEILYVMANPDDNLVGSTDDCHDEFFVVYIGGRNPFSCGGGDAGIFISSMQICFDYHLIGNYCPANSTQQQYTYGNASTFNCGTPIGPDDFIPENSILIIQTSPFNTIPVDLGEICNLGLPVYIIALNTPANCTGGFIPNTTSECNSCALQFWPDWCHEGEYYGSVFLNYDLPSNPTNGWGISNVSGGGVYGNVVPDINISMFFSGTEVIPLPLTWEIPSDFCQEHNPGTYNIVGVMDYWSSNCPPLTSQAFEITISCLQIDAGADISICEGETAILEGDNSGNTGTYEWTSNGDGTFGDATSLQTDYEPGINDILNGSVVLTLTLNSANTSCESVSDDLILTIIESIQANAGEDQTICNGDIAQLSGIFSGGGNNPNVEWTSDGDGIFENANSQQTNYSPGTNDIASGSVSISLTISDPSNACEPSSSEMLLTILQLQVDAGADQTICFEDLAFLNGTAIGGTDVTWTTSGDGIFGDAHFLQTTYTPGPGDINAGTTMLTLTNVDASGICDPVSSTLQLTINSILVPLNLPNSICENAAPLNLSTLQSGIYGSWSGPGVSNNTFNPAGLIGNTTLTFDPDTGQCAVVVIASINVQAVVIPSITGVPSSLCEGNVPISLPVLQNGIPGSWAGPGITLNTFDPSGLSGTVMINFTPDPGLCAQPVTASINIVPTNALTISGVPDSICQTDSPIALPVNQSGIEGVWSGLNVSNNTFDPAGQSGMITLIFTPHSGQCSETAQWNIAIENSVSPIISDLPSVICQADLPISLPTIQNGYSGNWSGPGVTNNTFDPGGLSGFISLFFNPDTGQCANVVVAIITVEPGMPPPVTGIPDTICETGEPVNLPTFQGGIAGNWSGSGVSNNTFNPYAQNGNVTLIFIPDAEQCAIQVTTAIFVSAALNPIITGIPHSLCQGDSSLVLSGSLNGISGDWSGQNVTANNFDPGALDGVYVLTFTPFPGQCALPSSTQIIVNTSPHFINLYAECDSNSQGYYVAFDIIGGDQLSYTINGNPVGGTTFISSPISSDSSEYVFTLDDANGCGPVYVEGSMNCDCITFAGTMNFSGAPLKVCAGSDFIIPFNGDAQLDSNDLSEFVLHDLAGNKLGTMYGSSQTTTFTFPPGLVLGQIYFISPIAGSNDGQGNIDLNDPCLSVAQGIPVVFYLPHVTMSSGGIICPADCITYTFDLNGEKPFVLNYTVSANGALTDQVLITDSSKASIVLCPSDYGITNGTIDIIPLSVADANCTVELTTFPASQTIVLSSSNAFIEEVICYGESISVNGTVYDQSNPTGVQTLQNGQGCDSTIYVDLSFYQPSIHEINQTLCFGGSLIINGTVYNEARPEGTEILPGESMNGCDSIIHVQLEFDSVVMSVLQTTLCPGESIEINGTTYDVSNATGSELFPAGSSSGCDSLVNINLSFYPAAVSILNPKLCKGDMIVVNGTVYDENNASGIEVLSNASVLGCDSVIEVVLTFIPDAYGYLIDTLNAGESITLNGTVYDQYNSQGIEVLVGGSVAGCDSTIEITLFYHQTISALIETQAPVCHGEFTGMIVLKEINGGIPPYLISIDGGIPIEGKDFPILISGLSPGLHELTILDALLVAREYDLIIPETPEIEVDAGPDLLVQSGEDAALLAKASFDVATWSWSPVEFLSCANCPDPLVIKPEYDITYTILATDENGCQSSDEVILTISYEDEFEIYVPDVFSPNGDMINDNWRIYSSDENTRLLRLHILDRWGGIIFSCSDKLLNDAFTGWNGTYREKDMGSGVYVFSAILEKHDGKIVRIQGDITLIR